MALLGLLCFLLVRKTVRILRDFQGSCGASGDIIMWQQQHQAVFIIITKRIDILDIPSNLPG